MAEHGTRSQYAMGCRCADCREANAVYARGVREPALSRIELRREDWMTAGACKGSTDLFFPGRGATYDVDECKKLCRSCPVRAECLAYAMRNGEHFGVWGGLSERERRRLRRQRRAA
jgi:WhiB family transcriptional regulator, redox-sensing transcriptional regulator